MNGHWLHSALTDEAGQYDIAYIGMGALVLIVLGAIPWVLVLATIALFTGKPLADLWGVGAAVGAICGGFAAALGSLAGYMAATRRPSPRTDPAPPASLHLEASIPQQPEPRYDPQPPIGATWQSRVSTPPAPSASRPLGKRGARKD